MYGTKKNLYIYEINEKKIRFLLMKIKVFYFPISFRRNRTPKAKAFHHQTRRNFQHGTSITNILPLVYLQLTATGDPISVYPGDIFSPLVLRYGGRRQMSIYNTFPFVRWTITDSDCAKCKYIRNTAFYTGAAKNEICNSRLRFGYVCICRSKYGFPVFIDSVTDACT